MAGHGRTSKLHALVFSLPFQGHINPTLHLSLKLASNDISVTFVHLEFIDDMISKAHNTSNTKIDQAHFFSEAQRSGLDMRYATISDGLPIDFDRSVNFEEFVDALLRVLPLHVDEFVGKWIESNPSSNPFIVADSSYAWLTPVATKYNLVSVGFWTEPALVFSLNYHIGLLKEHGHFACKDEVEEDISYIPGVESINTRDFMPYIKEPECRMMVAKAISKAFEEIEKVDFILHNIVEELEIETLSVLNKIQLNYAIGPINFSRSSQVSITNSLWSESDCTQWLYSKPPGSVLYISFGSMVQTSKQVIQEIANGLLLSDVNFIWVIRSGLVNSDDTDILPDGFNDDIKDRGLIVPWCNQVSVLSNPAVGGFLTHCGWNSVMESIWCGVPMICYPVTYDQPVNRKLVVDDWKIGINLCDGKLVDREKVAEKIRSLMNGPISGGLNQEMEKVKETFHSAMEIGGSSDRNFNMFIQDLKAKTGATAPEA